LRCLPALLHRAVLSDQWRASLQNPTHGIIGLIILFVGLRFAWQFTAGRTILVSGPHTPSPAGVI
jgi:hypothetical protein